MSAEYSQHTRTAMGCRWGKDSATGAPGPFFWIECLEWSHEDRTTERDIINTTGTDGTFTVSASGPGGQVELPQLVNVALTAASLITVEVPDDVQDGEVTITATVPVVVQRRTARGHGVVGFGIVGALPIRSR